MNFRKFAVNTTNIFPASNTNAGGQLLSEWNLRSRESVCTDPNISYMIGPSYTHGESDFSLSKYTDGAGVVVDGASLEIAPGKCLLNGHYVESLVPMVINLLDANVDAQRMAIAPLKGKLVVGLRAMYSTETMLAGSLSSIENEEYYDGVQVVILPPNEFKLPKDVPSDAGLVTAHLKLGEFTFVNGKVTSIVQNTPGKYQMLPASRIHDVENLLSGDYVTKQGLQTKKLYAFGGKGGPSDSPESLSGNPTSTWCDVTDSLMVWDSTPQLTTKKQTVLTPGFVQSSDDVVLQIPHKQVDGMKDGNGKQQFYKPVSLPLPKASYSKGTPGVVDRSFTDNIKAIGSKMNSFYQAIKGKQLGYLSSLDDRATLPTVNQSTWEPGDYVLVNQDNTIVQQTSEVQPPSTLYVVLPGLAASVGDPVVELPPADPEYVPVNYPGICVASENLTFNDEANYLLPTDTEPSPEVKQEVINRINTLFKLPNASYRGTPNKDYFELHFVNDQGTVYKKAKCLITAAQDKQFSDPVCLTREFTRAQENLVGGFLNVPETALDGGYVHLDENGHLRLLDYELLRSGTLAYSLSDDFEVPSGLTIEGVQSMLDEYVNSRVVFRNLNNLDTSIDPYVINLTITLPEEDDGVTSNIFIRGLDSRFNTSICLHILGQATEATTINILDCNKIRIDPNISGTPNINLYRSNLYYDSIVMNKLSHIEDLSLWYEKYNSTDPNLIIDNMTVMETDSPIVSEDIDVWNEDVSNDNHYVYALKSITFSKSGDIIGCKIYIRNDTTIQTEIEDTGKYIIVADFKLPSGSGLAYPSARLTKQLKITGSFVTAYPVESPSGYITMTTNFSALTQVVNQYNDEESLSGKISILVDAALVENIEGISFGDSIDAWEPNSFHMFEGGVVG